MFGFRRRMRVFMTVWAMWEGMQAHRIGFKKVEVRMGYNRSDYLMLVLGVKSTVKENHSLRK